MRGGSIFRGGGEGVAGRPGRRSGGGGHRPGAPWVPPGALSDGLHTIAPSSNRFAVSMAGPEWSEEPMRAWAEEPSAPKSVPCAHVDTARMQLPIAAPIKRSDRMEQMCTLSCLSKRDYLCANWTPFSILAFSSGSIFAMAVRSNVLSGPNGRTASAPWRPSTTLCRPAGVSKPT